MSIITEIEEARNRFFKNKQLPIGYNNKDIVLCLDEYSYEKLWETEGYIYSYIYCIYEGYPICVIPYKKSGKHIEFLMIKENCETDMDSYSISDMNTYKKIRKMLGNNFVKNYDNNIAYINLDYTEEMTKGINATDEFCKTLNKDKKSVKVVKDYLDKKLESLNMDIACDCIHIEIDINAFSKLLKECDIETYSISKEDIISISIEDDTLMFSYKGIPIFIKETDNPDMVGIIV